MVISLFARMFLTKQLMTAVVGWTILTAVSRAGFATDGSLWIDLATTRPPGEWAVLECDNSRAVLVAGGSLVVVDATPVASLDDYSHIRALTEARFGTQRKTEFRAKDGHRWEVFWNTTTPAKSGEQAIDYYSYFPNRHSRNYAIHVRVEYRSDIEEDSKSALTNQLQRFLESVLIQSKS